MSEDDKQSDNKNRVIVEDTDEEEGELVPDFIAEDIRHLNENTTTPLRRVAEKFQFPLTPNDYDALASLGLRFDNLEDAVGLSLPQLGINKRAFIFQVKESQPQPEAGLQQEEVKPATEPTVDEIEDDNPLANIDVEKELNKNEPGVIWPKTIWINPSYTIPRDAVLDEDFESCYSLKREDDFVIGPVFRLNRINYRAYDSHGRIYEGQAEGYVARVIQHEIDHLDGKLYTDYVQPDRVLQLPEFVKQYMDKTLPPLEKGVVPEFN